MLSVSGHMCSITVQRRTASGNRDTSAEGWGMSFYRQIGEVPPKRHTQFRQPDGGLYYEELMGEEGFSSDSALLYHRGVPSAIVDSKVWELPDLSTVANHPITPRHLKLHDLFKGADAGEIGRAHV